MSRRPAASRSALVLTSRQICVFRAVFADEGLGAANRTRRASFLAASVPLEHAEIVRPTRAPPTRALRRRGVVSLGKALTDSMTPTMKLAHPFDCLLTDVQRVQTPAKNARGQLSSSAIQTGGREPSG